MMKIKPRSLFFAPMDGITDALYRQHIFTLYPEWDYLATDFFRVPRQGKINPQRLISHLGSVIFQRPDWKAKTIFQIITGPSDQYVAVAQQLRDLAIPWLDLNIGCPSRLVNGSGGGAALLGRPEQLTKILRSLRSVFPYYLTVKMRAGIDDHRQLPALINIIQEEGADAIFLHARTKRQYYQGAANWEYFRMATDVANIPIIGNGDIWDQAALARLYQETNCHAAMLGRSALKTPWFPQMLIEHHRGPQIKKYFYHLENLLQQHGNPEMKILHRLKALTRYIFDDLPTQQGIRPALLHSPDLSTFKNLLTTLGENSAAETTGH